MRKSKNHELEILDIIKTKDWDRARKCNDKNLYAYIRRHRDTDKSCRIVWNHVKAEIRNFKSEVLEIIETKNWDRARKCNDKILYGYVRYRKDTDESCKIIWEHIKTKKHCPYTIKDYLQYYFKHGKLTKTSNGSLYNCFTREIKNGNQCCIDIKNLITAADTYKDPVALETLELIKNHLEKEGLMSSFFSV